MLVLGRGNAFSQVRLIRGASALVLLAFALLLLPSISGQEGKTDEYRAKANFLAAFPNFMEWPADAFPSAQAPLLICVFGDFSFGTSLAETTRGASIRGRRIEIRWARKERDLRACHILFVSRSEGKRYARIFKAIQGASVLTVGETPDFLASGGAINFLFDADKLQFEVNMAAAKDAHVRISSNMLALARHVVSRAEAAKS
ncbi:MAG: YfiR family protein [Candidatus Acidiferrales bacterium]